MHRGSVAALVLVLSSGIGCSGPRGPEGPSSAQQYVGASECATCHADIATLHGQSGHKFKLNKVVNGQPPSYPFSPAPPLPEGYTWSDISYVIGGYNWKARFMNQRGFIITDRPNASAPDPNYLNQWNLPNPELGLGNNFSKYHSGEQNLKYDCGECHTTGFVPDGHQDGLEGIVGRWAETGIQCEECHGPGSQHVKDPRGIRMDVDRSAEACGRCHRRGDVTEIDARGGFIEHHEQYEEFLQSKHIALECTICHNPHQGVVQLRKANQATTRVACESCHFKQEQQQKVAAHDAAGVRCVDCHMARIIKNAVGDPAKFTGDIRTHLVAIDPQQIAQFTPDGKLASSQIGLDFACRHCHVAGGRATPKDDAQLQGAATGYHGTAPVTTGPVTP